MVWSRGTRRGLMIKWQTDVAWFTSKQTMKQNFRSNFTNRVKCVQENTYVIQDVSSENCITCRRKNWMLDGILSFHNPVQETTVEVGGASSWFNQEYPYLALLISHVQLLHIRLSITLSTRRGVVRAIFLGLLEAKWYKFSANLSLFL